MAHDAGRTITPTMLYTAAAAAVLVSLLAWAVEWSGMAYVCPYCRVQRTVIGVLGLLTLFARAGRHRRALAVVQRGRLRVRGGGDAALQRLEAHFRRRLQFQRTVVHRSVAAVGLRDAGPGGAADAGAGRLPAQVALTVSSLRGEVPGMASALNPSKR